MEVETADCTAALARSAVDMVEGRLMDVYEAIAARRDVRNEFTGTSSPTSSYGASLLPLMRRPASATPSPGTS